MPACRFAPSPNGPLHLGHAYSARCNARLAARLGARLLLRLEDIDTVRCTPALEAGVLEDLAWLGLAFDAPPRRQRERFSAYRATLDGLAGRGLLYPCFCTRGAILGAVGGMPAWPRDPDGSPLYPGTCRKLTPRERAARIAAGQPHALRLDMGHALETVPGPLEWREFGEGVAERTEPADPARWGDAVLGRKDIPASYHLAVVVDDADQGITDVVRGKDLFAATGLHRLLQALLELPAPRYHHHRLVPDVDGRKLSKSRGATGLRALREAGLGPEAVWRRIDALMGE